MKVDKTVDKWKAPAKNDARLLGMPNIPQPLHGPGCQPRTIVGTSIWNQMRIKCYEDAGYKCEACGFQGEPGKAQVHAHEVFSINYKTGESKFERLCCLCKKCHLGVIHSGRALTQYGKGMIPFQDMLNNAEHGFKIVSEYNKTHKRQIYMFNTIQDWGSKYPELKEPLARLIKQYNIKFYGVVNKRHGACDWGDWKMIFNGREYPTPYKDASEWEKAMEKMNEKQGRGLMQKRMSGGAFDELDKLLKGEEDGTN